MLKSIIDRFSKIPSFLNLIYQSHYQWRMFDAMTKSFKCPKHAGEEQHSCLAPVQLEQTDNNSNLESSARTRLNGNSWGVKVKVFLHDQQNVQGAIFKHFPALQQG